MILIDKKFVTPEEYEERVMIIGDDIYEFGYRERDYDLFRFLGVEPLDEYGDEMPLEEFVDEVAIAFLDFLDYVSCDNIDERYVC